MPSARVVGVSFLVFRIDGERLVDCHEVYLCRRVAVPIVVGGYAEMSLEEPREFLTQREGCSPACPAWIAFASFLVIAIITSVISVDNVVMSKDG